MSDTIIVAIISCSTSLVGIYLTSKNANNKMTNQLDKAVALLQADIQTMKEDVKEHNHYAKMFAETMPVVQEQMRVANHRIKNLENKVG